VAVTFEGTPLLATAAVVQIAVEAADKKADIETLIQRARAISTVSNSIARGVPVRFPG
jgi:organic hydroperoxide reductase OsmC/OhrA